MQVMPDSGGMFYIAAEVSCADRPSDHAENRYISNAARLCLSQHISFEEAGPARC